MERIEELYDTDQTVTIQTNPEEVPPIVAWEVEAALRKIKNLKEAGKDKFNIETLKTGDETIAKQLAKLYTKCITERRIPTTRKEANYGDNFQEREHKIPQEIQTNLLATTYTVHKNNNNYAGEETR